MKSSKVVALLAACAFMVMGDTALAQGDPAITKAGAKAFARCRACHLFDDSGKHRVGPNLAGIFGRAAGAVEDFPRYSDALKESGIVWDETTLEQWLTNPADMVDGTGMKFLLADPGLRADVIAYLKQGVQ